MVHNIKDDLSSGRSTTNLTTDNIELVGEKIREGKLRLCDMINHESWFYQSHLGHKQINAKCIGEGESQRTVISRARSRNNLQYLF